MCVLKHYIFDLVIICSVTREITG